MCLILLGRDDKTLRDIVQRKHLVHWVLLMSQLRLVYGCVLMRFITLQTESVVAKHMKKKKPYKKEHQALFQLIRPNTNHKTLTMTFVSCKLIIPYVTTSTFIFLSSNFLSRSKAKAVLSDLHILFKIGPYVNASLSIIRSIKAIDSESLSLRQSPLT